VERRRVIEAKLDAIGYYDDGSEGDEVHGEEQEEEEEEGKMK
jgi:hypothetical protein